MILQHANTKLNRYNIIRITANYFYFQSCVAQCRNQIYLFIIGKLSKMKIEQTDSTSSATHLCISFRISNCYLFLILLQLALGLTLFVALFNKLIIHAAVIQILIGFFISLDLLIKYFSSEKNFFEEKENYVDIIVLGILIFCIGASQVNFSKFLYYNGDSIMSAVCVVTRYCIQLFRLICLFKTSKQMIQIHKISDDINLELIGEQLCETDANSNAQ